MNVTIRDWTFTHWWVRPVVGCWFGIYHKNVIYSGTENIHWDKPLIFAPSHQNAFSDALCLILPTGYTEKKFIYPLIRADAFGQNRALDWMLTSFHMLPVYRPRDKVNLKEQNKSVFAQCGSILAKRRNLLIHPEGICIPKKRIYPFKKGLARIALAAEADHQFDLGTEIVPVGINYNSITQPRQGIHVRFGKAIEVADFREKYHDHPARAIGDLTQKVQQGVEDTVVNIRSDRFYDLHEDMFTLNRSLKDIRPEYTLAELHENQAISHSLEHVDEHELSKRTDQIKDLKQLLHKQNLSFEQSFSGLKGQLDGFKHTKNGLLLVLLSPVMVYGWINNVLPWWLIKKLADNIPEKQFKSSARMTAGLLLFPLCYLLQSALVLAATASWAWSLVYLISIPFAGILTLNSWELFLEWKQKFRILRLTNKEKLELRQLIKTVLEIS